MHPIQGSGYNFVKLFHAVQKVTRLLTHVSRSVRKTGEVPVAAKHDLIRGDPTLPHSIMYEAQGTRQRLDPILGPFEVQLSQYGYECLAGHFGSAICLRREA